MKRYLLLFSFSIASLLCSSQTNKFDLSKYKLPDIKRQQIDVSIYSSGRNTTTKVYYEYEDQVDTIKRNSNYFDGQGYLNYSFYRNSKKLQSYIYSSLRGLYNIDKEKDINYVKDQFNLNSEFLFNYDLKYFLTPDNWFINTVPKINTFYSNQNNKLDSENSLKTLYIKPSVAIGGGKGRIEQVQDFRHAVLLLEELKKRGVSKHDLSESKILEFASLISDLKNQRFFDERKQKEKELVALDSFLVKNGVIEEQDISYFTGLEDIWSYGGLQIRESGNQFVFSAKPEYYYLNSLNETENNIRENWSLTYNLAYISKNPLSIKWQTDYVIGIEQNYTYWLSKTNEWQPDRSYNSNIYLSGKAGYYPNTRTYFDFFANFNLVNYSEEQMLDFEDCNFNIYLSNSGYYYISEKLRLGYSINYFGFIGNLLKSEYRKDYTQNILYNINLSYAIF
jgi:hypothetical protein